MHMVFDICILYKIWGYITKDHRFSLGLLTSKKIWIWKRWMKFKPWGNFASNASRLIHNSKVFVPKKRGINIWESTRVSNFLEEYPLVKLT